MSVPYRAEGDSFQADKPQVWLDARLGGRVRRAGTSICIPTASGL